MEDESRLKCVICRFGCGYRCGIDCSGLGTWDQTAYCEDCKEMVEYSAGDEGIKELLSRGRPNTFDQCPKCSGTNLVDWHPGEPCIKCSRELTHPDRETIFKWTRHALDNGLPIDDPPWIRAQRYQREKLSD